MQFISVQLNENSTLDQESRDVHKVAPVIVVEKIETKARCLKRRIGHHEVLNVFGQTAQHRLPVGPFERRNGQT